MTKKIAFLGMFAGYYREYNPGCLLILHCTIKELKKRIPEIEYDIYSRDRLGIYGDIREEKIEGMTIKHFTEQSQQKLMEEIMIEYDAIVIGGDVVWAGGLKEEDAFFLNSKKLLNSSKPLVIYNCVHTFLPKISLGYIAKLIRPLAMLIKKTNVVPLAEYAAVNHRKRFKRLSKRSAYISVRTEYVKDMLNGIGVKNVHCVPDPVLGIDLSEIRAKKTGIEKKTEKPLMGISVNVSHCDALIDSIKKTKVLDKYEILIYPYSRQYLHYEFVVSVRQRVGSEFIYINEYPSPYDAVGIIKELSVSINDTFHGTILAIVSGIPFICIDYENSRNSRKENLLRSLGLENRNINFNNAGKNYKEHVGKWCNALLNIEKEPYLPETIKNDETKQKIKNHFDEIAEIIKKIN